MPVKCCANCTEEATISLSGPAAAEKNLLDAINWLLEYNIPFDRVNDHCPENIKRYGKGSGKIYANIYIDDKNLGGFPGWLRCLEEIERMESAENDQI